MSTQYGVFNDEGCVADDFWSEEEAHAWADKNNCADEDLEVLEICPDHFEEPRNGCEQCAEEEDEEEPDQS